MSVKSQSVFCYDELETTDLHFTASIVFEILFYFSADLNHRTMKGEDQLPIHFAAKHDSVEVFDLLVKLGADPLARDANGKTPFYLAAEAGKLKENILEGCRLGRGSKEAQFLFCSNFKDIS